MSENEKEMRCIHCGSIDLTVTGAIIECNDCGEEHNLTDELGFLNYGQGGFENFVHFSYKELYEAMGKDDDAESWHDLFVEPQYMGTGALEVIPCKDALKELQELCQWMTGEVYKKYPEARDPDMKGKAELVGFVRKSRHGNALRLAVLKSELNKVPIVEGMDGTRYVVFLMNLSKVKMIVNDEQDVTYVAQLFPSD